MLLIGRNFYRGLDPMSVSALAAHLRLPAGLVKEFMDIFTQAKLVLPLADEETFVLGRDPGTIGVKDILDGVRNSTKKEKIQREQSREESEIDGLLLDLDNSSAKILEGKTLQGLVLRLNAPAARGKGG
jgi:DNA-binding IscR family transcriptional regulator